jgi:hypothetical protein
MQGIHESVGRTRLFAPYDFWMGFLPRLILTKELQIPALVGHLMSW